MKAFFSSGILALSFATTLVQADDLGINVVLEGEIKPGVYGRVELSKNSHPQLVYHEPRVVVVEQHVDTHPVYLHVPPGHARNWSKHCKKYHACSRPVYFVMSEEYHEKPKKKKHKHDHHGKKHHKHH
jgi:hypothetical protein